MLSLLQPAHLTKMTTLKLGYNNIGDDTNGSTDLNSVADYTDSAEYWFWNGPLGAKNLDALFLDNNNIHAIDANLLTDASNSVTKLYLNGNDLSTFNYNNGEFFKKILSDPNSVLDLSGNDSIDEQDKNTLYVMEKAIETNGANLTIDQSVLSAVLIAAISDTTWRGTLTVKGVSSVTNRIETPVLSAWLTYSVDDKNKWNPLRPTAEVIEEISAKSPKAVQGLSQTDKTNLQKMIDAETDTALKAALEDMLALANTSASSVSITGSLDFGAISVEDLYKGVAVSSRTQMRLTGTLGRDETLSVAALPWADATDTADAADAASDASNGNSSAAGTFTPDMTLEISGSVGNAEIKSTVRLSGSTPVTVTIGDGESSDGETGESAGSRDFDLSVTQASVSGLPVSLGAGKYQGSLLWNVVVGP